MKIGYGEVLEDLGHPVAFYPSLVPICGSVNATLFLCQLLYWRGKQADPDGWIYKTREEMEAETGLSRHAQDGARGLLREKGIIKEVRRGVPGKIHYQIQMETLTRLCWNHFHPDDTLPESGNVHAAPLIKDRSGNLSRRKPKNSNVGKRQPITETTTEITQIESPILSPKTSEIDPSLARFWVMTLDYANLPDKHSREVRTMEPRSWTAGVLTLQAPAYLARRRALAHELLQLLAPAAPVDLREVRIVNGQ
jgi:hypothetical protein